MNFEYVAVLVSVSDQVEDHSGILKFSSKHVYKYNKNFQLLSKMPYLCILKV